jgi:hypothetical protein
MIQVRPAMRVVQGSEANARFPRRKKRDASRGSFAAQKTLARDDNNLYHLHHVACI